MAILFSINITAKHVTFMETQCTQQSVCITALSCHTSGWKEICCCWRHWNLYFLIVLQCECKNKTMSQAENPCQFNAHKFYIAMATRVTTNSKLLDVLIWAILLPGSHLCFLYFCNFNEILLGYICPLLYPQNDRDNHNNIKIHESLEI